MAEVASAFVSLMFSAKGATGQITNEVAHAGAKAGTAGGDEASKKFVSNMKPGNALKGKLATEVAGAGAHAGVEGGSKAGRSFTSRFNLGNLRSKVTSDVEHAGTAAGEHGGHAAGVGMVHGIKHHLKEHMREIVTIVGGAFALERGVDFLKESTEEARKFQKVSAQTGAVLKSTGGSAHVSAKEVDELSRSISEKAGVDHGAIQAGANLLLTFRNVRNEAGKGNDIFTQSTKVVTDMGAALHKGPTVTAKLLGKALNDPVKGMSALARVGAQFTDQQKATNKALVQGGDANAAMAMGLVGSTTEFNAAIKQNHGNVAKTVQQLTKDLTPAQKKYYDHLTQGGHVMEAQKVILKGLSKEYAGSAAAIATPGEKAKVAFNDLKEEVGNLLLPALNAVEKFLTSKVVPAIGSFVDGLKSGEGAGGKVRDVFLKVKDSVGTFVQQMRDGYGPGGKLATVLGKLRDGFKAAWPYIKDVLGFLAKNKATVAVFAGTILTIVAAMKIWAAVTKAMAVVQALLDGTLVANPIGLIVVAIAALVAGLFYAYKHSKRFHDIVDKVFSVLKVVGKFVAKVFVGYLKLLGLAYVTLAIVAVGALGVLVKAVFWAFGKIVDAAAAGLGWIPGIGGKIKGAQKVFHEFAGKTTDALKAVEDKLKGVRDGIAGVKGKKVTVEVHTKFTYTGKAKYAAAAAIGNAQANAKHADIAGARAAGGPVGRGKLYLVGEQGPELFSPPTDGVIVPHSAVRNDVAPGGPAAARGRQGGPQFVVERVEAQDVNHFLREMQQRSRAVAGGGVRF